MSQDDDPIFGRPACALGARCVEILGARARFAFSERARDRVAKLTARCSSALLKSHLEIEIDELRSMASGTLEAALFIAALDAWSTDPPEPEMMGIVNVTPDSFSDGGLFLDPSRAIDHGLRLAAEGATWLDVGGESTRPGADAVAESEELRRVLPVVGALVQAGVARISIDTRKADVAREALDAGAHMVNDVGAGLDDPRILDLVAEREVDYCLMHRQGGIADMQGGPKYEDIVAEVTTFLRERVAYCLAAGISRDRILVDPGIGFGKVLPHNIELLRCLRELRSLGLPLLLGVSRKSFIGHITGSKTASERIGGTAAAISFCVRGGAKVLRVHDVAVMAEAAAVARALEAPAALHPDHSA